jgi:hypothetical protein
MNIVEGLRRRAKAKLLNGSLRIVSRRVKPSSSISAGKVLKGTGRATRAISVRPHHVPHRGRIAKKVLKVQKGTETY